MDKSESLSSADRDDKSAIELLQDPLATEFADLGIIKLEPLDEDELEIPEEINHVLEKEVISQKSKTRKKGKESGLRDDSEAENTKLEFSLLKAEGKLDSKGEWTCKHCSKVYALHHSFMNHLHKAHQIGFQHICEYCDKPFIRESALKTHLAKHETLEMKRSDNDISAEENQLLKLYGEEDKDSTTWWCHKCGTSCTEKFRFLYHLKRYHNIKMSGFEHTCPVCELDFRSGPAKRLHIKRVHKDTNSSDLDLIKKYGHKDEEDAWWCSKCGLRYVKTNMFALHLKKTHKVGPPPVSYECEYCMSSFNHRYSLNSHIVVVHPDKLVKASVDSSAPMKILLENLNKLKEHGKKNESDSWVCNLCGGIYVSESAFIKHLMKIHQVDVGSVSFKCEICDQTFLTTKALDDHVAKTHAGTDVESNNEESMSEEYSNKVLEYGSKNKDNGRWACKQCQSTFVKQIRLVYHLHRVHKITIGQFDVRCVQCGQTFLSTSALRTHIKFKHPPNSAPTKASADDILRVSNTISKEGTKCPDGSWQCNRCGTNFSRDTVFMYHLKRYHGVDLGNFQHKCPYCQLDFMVFSGLKYHVLNKHPNDYKEFSSQFPTRSVTSNKSKLESDNSDDENDDMALSELKKVAEKSSKKSKRKGRDRISGLSTKQRLAEEKVMNEMGEKDSEGWWWCNNCGLRYAKEGVFLYHLKRVHKVLFGGFQYKCSQCKKEFLNKPALRTHINRAHPQRNLKLKKAIGKVNIKELHSKIVRANFVTDVDNRLVCKSCGSRFFKESSCLLHLKREHNMFIEGFDFKCNLCNLDYRDSHSLRTHVRRTHGEVEEKEKDKCIVKDGKFICKICSNVFHKKSKFLYHYAKVHNENNDMFKFKCKICSLKYISSKGVRAHLVTAHGKSDFSSSSIELLNQNKPKPSGGVKLNISVDKFVLGKISLNSLAENNDDKTYPVVVIKDDIHNCRRCGILVSSRDKLMNHIQIYHPAEYDAMQLLSSAMEIEDELLCKVCNHSFFNITEFEKHVNEQHGMYEERSDEVLRCGECSFVTMSDYIMNMHYKTVHGVLKRDDSKWPCKMCGLVVDCKERFLNHVELSDCYLEAFSNSDCKLRCTRCFTLCRDISGVKKHIEGCNISMFVKIYGADVDSKSQIVSNELENHSTNGEKLEDTAQSINQFNVNDSVPGLGCMITENMEYEQDESGTFRCLQCKFQAVDRDTIISHVAHMHSTLLSNVSVVCTLCLVQFRSNSTLRKHIQVMHMSKKSKTVVKNQQIKERRPASCGVCSKIFRSNEGMIKHFRQSHVDDPFLQTDDSFEVVKRDVNLKWVKNPSLYKCKLCPHTCKTRAPMYIHQLDKHWSGEKPFKCQHCDFKTVTDSMLRKHLQSFHPESSEAKNITCLCESCGMTFHNISTFNQHRESHNPPKYKCEFCKYTTHLRTSIDNHRRSHTKEKPFKCTFSGCDYVCANPTSLRVHNFAHYPDKYMQTCNICGFKTVNKYIMNSHVKQHDDGSVNFSCEHCPFTSKDKKLLSFHCRTHAEAQSCQFCEFSTKYKKTMKSHLNNRHGVLVAKDEKMQWF